MFINILSDAVTLSNVKFYSVNYVNSPKPTSNVEKHVISFIIGSCG